MYSLFLNKIHIYRSLSVKDAIYVEILGLTNCLDKFYMHLM